jgi:hypothetical protein
VGRQIGMVKPAKPLANKQLTEPDPLEMFKQMQ